MIGHVHADRAVMGHPVLRLVLSADAGRRQLLERIGLAAPRDGRATPAPAAVRGRRRR